MRYFKENDVPYIKHSDRMRLKYEEEMDIRSAGELNYILTVIAIYYVNSKGLSYSSINDVLGAFEGAKAEFYRRVAVPYEDSKIKENGDVYHEGSTS